MAQFMVVIMVIWIGSAIPMLADDMVGPIETNYGVSASSLLGPACLATDLKYCATGAAWTSRYTASSSQWCP